AKLGCACWIIDTLRPRLTKRGMSCSISVVLPLPDHPANPNTFIPNQAGGSRPAKSVIVSGRHSHADIANGTAHFAFGKNSCSPPILYPAIVFCPSGETTQSTNAWPRSFFTLGCLAGFTSITPYSLNRCLSPSTTLSSSPQFLNEIQVPRSARM